MGKSIGEYVSERIWSKLGIEQDAYFSVDSVGNEFAGGGLEPDLWVWLQIKPDEGLARVAEKRQLDRIEENSHEFFQRVNSGYNTFMAPRSNVCEIDATLPEMEIMAKIVYALEKILV